MNLRKLSAAALLLGAIGSVHAGRPVVRIDTTILRIGERTQLHLSYTYRTDQGAVAVQWPIITDTLSAHIEVISDSDVDTVLLRPDQDPYLFEQRRTLTVTSFDTGFWAIRPFRFIIDQTPTETEPLLLEVRNTDLDSGLVARDLKPVIDLPFSLGYWLSQHLTWIAGGAAILLALIYFLFIRKPRPKKEDIAAPSAPLPVHVRTLSALEEIREKKLWQQGFVKQHHSEITDVLRGYIEERFKVPALESTTDELIVAMKLSRASRDQLELLGNTLRLADLVKFAKMTPTGSENELVLKNAIMFVQATTIEQEPGTKMT